jgi:hypothetical protein
MALSICPFARYFWASFITDVLSAIIYPKNIILYDHVRCQKVSLNFKEETDPATDAVSPLSRSPAG